MNIPSFLRFCILILLFQASMSADTLSPSQSLADTAGNTLVSSDGSFELGFFSPGSSSGRYLGIWYKNIPVRTVVWVANRDNPINGSSGLLKVTTTGDLLLFSSNTTAVWSANSTKQARNPVLQLMNSGNLVTREETEQVGGSESEDYPWQSFDYPTDTLLPGMKHGIDLRTGLDRRLTAWKSSDDPSPGELTWALELQGNPEFVIWQGNHKHFRSGPWNGIGLSGVPTLRPNTLFNFSYVANEQEVYYMYTLRNKSIISRLVLNETDSTAQRYTWNKETRSWKLFAYLPRDYCDVYGQCGAYGNCDNTGLPLCQCLNRFQPKSPDRWNSMDWNEGCVRNKPLNCASGDRFIKYERLKPPDTSSSWVNKTMSLVECKVRCLQNCSCMAYAAFDVRGEGTGCTIWLGDLIDIRQFSNGGQDLYIRMSAAESGSSRNRRRKLALTVAIPTVFFTLTLIIVGNYILKRKGHVDEIIESEHGDPGKEEEEQDLELPVFEFSIIAQATNNFSMYNKLGEGGFGPVYKGTLVDGQEIAVKRLSTVSGQGLNEFRNEVILIAKLQHRNLVRLLGCCIQGEEKMLVYEYMPNRSLDSFIFDEGRGRLLDWSTRYEIICGIARGILYLHQDSRLRIIHRDLKASNVLLDRKMNPKISDFGLARIFGGDQTQGKTIRVVGTYGYMAPEYAIDGLFSVKSDVFSFGILLLEIISGLKNRGFYHPDHNLNLIGTAWKLWREDRPLELVDDFLEDNGNQAEIIRCIHISLLCIQQHPEDRPSMSSVLLMLGSKTELPQPKEPGLLLYNNVVETTSSGKKMSSSVNEISITLLQAR